MSLDVQYFNHRGQFCWHAYMDPHLVPVDERIGLGHLFKVMAGLATVTKRLVTK